MRSRLANSSDFGSVVLTALQRRARRLRHRGIAAGGNTLASGSFADRDTTTVGTGTLTIRFGTTDYDGLDSYNSFANPDRGTLNLHRFQQQYAAGHQRCHNAADAGVRAAIVNDGSGYRLLLSSDFTGAENSLQVSTVM